jgi:hypothetical protein
MKNRKGAYPLRLRLSLKAAVEKLSKRDGMPINQFILTAVAEKVSALETAGFFTERKARADMKAFKRTMTRAGGERPRPADELPEANAL